MFESGTSKIQDLERYISDDVERYGSRLLELEKKLVNAYRETVCPYLRITRRISQFVSQTAAEVLDDEGLFEEDEEDAGALAMYVFPIFHCSFYSYGVCTFSGDFADALGEDYLGLRELGIAAEFGMTSLSIPKKLLKGRRAQNKPAVCVPILH